MLEEGFPIFESKFLYNATSETTFLKYITAFKQSCYLLKVF